MLRRLGKVAKMRLLERDGMRKHSEQVLKESRRVERNHNEFKIEGMRQILKGSSGSDDPSESEESTVNDPPPEVEDDTVIADDIKVEYHTHQAPPPPPPPPVVTSSESPKRPWWTPLAMTGILGSSGVGGAYMVADAIRNPAPVVEGEAKGPIGLGFFEMDGVVVEGEEDEKE